MKINTLSGGREYFVSLHSKLKVGILNSPRRGLDENSFSLIIVNFTRKYLDAVLLKGNW